MKGAIEIYVKVKGIKILNWKYKECVWFRAKVQGVYLIFYLNSILEKNYSIIREHDKCILSRLTRIMDLTINLKGNYTLLIYGLTHLQVVYSWFQNWHSVHLSVYFLTPVTYILLPLKQNQIKTKQNKKTFGPLLFHACYHYPSLETLTPSSNWPSPSPWRDLLSSLELLCDLLSLTGTYQKAEIRWG